MSQALFDAATGLLDATIYSSAAVYSQETDRIFGRGWLMVAPLNWLTRHGSLVAGSMGDQPVLAWRGSNGEISVCENRCVGSEAALTEQERSTNDILVCSCHGWRYCIEPTEGCLTPHLVPRVEQYNGLLFACADPNAPPLSEYLGEFAWYWRMISDQLPGGIEIYGNATLRTHLGSNWKLAAEAYCGDTYRDSALTSGTRQAIGDAPPLASYSGFQAATAAGAMVVGAGDAPARQEHPSNELSPLLATLFPNLSFDGRSQTLHVWHPRGPERTEAYTYCVVGRDEAPEIKEKRRRRCQLLFGPTGMETQDHEPVWRSITAASRGLISRRHRLNLQMGLGRERVTNLPGKIADLASEMNQRAFYAWWQDRMDQPSTHVTEGQRLQLTPWANRQGSN